MAIPTRGATILSRMESAAEASSPRPRRLGRYVLGRRIGAGGMAAVFAARQTGPLGLGRLVALKVMSTALLGDPELERLFVREAGISARLQHDNIVRVYEVDETESTYFITMELVLGATLRETGLSPRPPLSIALAILLQVADALHYAHELRSPTGEALRIVHQDVTPHNVMVTYRGVVKLLDFGVARIGHLDASRTETIRGKPAYLAPEQLAGERIDRRTDLFALGIVMHELLSGERLFQTRSDLGTYEAVMSKPIPPLDGVPEGIAAVCLRALERKPEDRYPDADAMRRALRDATRSASVDIASREALAAWVQQVAPPTWTLEELERETLHEESRRQRLTAVQDLPTQSSVAPPTEAATRIGGTPASRPRRLPLVFAAGALGLGGVLAYGMLGPSTPPASASAGIVPPLPPAPEPLRTASPSPTEAPAPTKSKAPTETRTRAAAPAVATPPRPVRPPPAPRSTPKPPLPPPDHGIPSVRD